MSHKEKNANILPSCKRQLANMLNVTFWCLINKVANCGEPLSIVGLQCDCKYVDGVRHIAQHGIKDEEDLVLEQVVKIIDNIQMRRRLTFVEYVESTNEIENQQAHYNLKNNLSPLDIEKVEPPSFIFL